MKKEKVDYTFHTMLLSAIVIALICISYILFFYKYISISECFIYKHFGLYCPGCGGSRAVLNLFDGNFVMSLYYNPCVVYFVTIVLLYLLFKIIKHDNSIFVKYIHIFLYIGIALIFINCIIRNILMLIFDIYI